MSIGSWPFLLFCNSIDSCDRILIVSESLRKFDGFMLCEIHSGGLPMKAKPTRFWILTIALGWAFDFLFWEKPLGINFFLYVVFCISAGIYLLQADGLRLSRRAGLLLIPIAFLVAITFFRLEPMTVFLSISLTIFLMGVFSLTYLSGEWIRFALTDYLFGYLTLLGSMIARPLGFMAESKQDQTSQSEMHKGHFWAYVRGFVIALPVVSIFGALLSSADPIFA